MLTIDPVLTLLEGTQGFFICYDTSRVNLSCVVMPNDKVIIYASRQLNVYERNYLTHYLELVFIVFALKIWRLYFHDVCVAVLIYHKSLSVCVLLRKRLISCKRGS